MPSQPAAFIFHEKNFRHPASLFQPVNLTLIIIIPLTLFSTPETPGLRLPSSSLLTSFPLRAQADPIYFLSEEGLRRRPLPRYIPAEWSAGSIWHASKV